MIPLEIFVLAGGKSSRMGQDKGLVSFRGQPMISYVLSAVSELSADIRIITSNPDYSRFGCYLLSDLIPDIGPAGGVYTALKHADAELVLVVGCDMPLLSAKVFRELLNCSGTADIVVAGKDGRLEPLLAVYRRSCLNKWEQLLNDGYRKMSDFFQEFDTVIFDVNTMSLLNEDVFMNVNAPADLERNNQTVRLLAFGKLTDYLLPAQDFPWAGGAVAQFRKQLESVFPGLKGKTFRIAVNHLMAADDLQVVPGDEIALMPPFSGG